MKKTLITLASVAILSGAANAQTFPGFELLDFDNSIMTTSPNGGGTGHSWTTSGDSLLLNYAGFNSAPNILSVLTVNGQPLEELNFMNTGAQSISFNFTGSNSLSHNGFFFRDMIEGSFVDVHFNRLSAGASGPALTAADLNLTSAGWTVVDLAGGGVRLTSDGSATWVEANAAIDGIASGTLAFGISDSNDAVLFGARNTLTQLPVPEPSSAALLGLGGLALILRRRK